MSGMHTGAREGISRLSVRLSLLLCYVLVATALMSVAGVASASALNLTGSWSAVYHCEKGCAGTTFPATDVLTQAEGSEVVTGSNGTETIEGTLKGNTLTYHSSTGGYKAEGTLTVSADGNSWSGPVHDSNGTSGTYTAMRTSGGPTTKPETTQEKEAKEKQEKEAKEAKEKEEAAKKKPKGTQPTAMVVNCNQEMPDTPNAYFECFVEVFNASLAEPLAVPSGSVSFVVNPGGSGGFRGSNVCNLKASQLGANSSFCSIIYLAVPPGSIPIGTQPPITGTYSSDNVFASNKAQPRSPLPSVPQVSAQATGSSTSLTMTCPPGPVCTGAVQMTASGTQAKGSAAAAATVLVASGHYSIRAHKKAKVKLRLSKRGKALLKKHHHHLVLTLEIKPKTGAPVSKAIVLK
jgi:hypothetical protein